MPKLLPTPAQTVGPFFHYALPYERGNELALPGAAETVVLHGTVYDGAGAPVPDALIELWQADENGEAPSPAGALQRDGITFAGYGRCATDAEGRYRFFTRTPGAMDGQQVPFFSLCVFARGLLDRVFTRAYLDPEGVARDLADVPAERRSTLAVIREQEAPGRERLRFDIRLQGSDETVFLEFSPATASPSEVLEAKN